MHILNNVDSPLNGSTEKNTIKQKRSNIGGLFTSPNTNMNIYTYTNTSNKVTQNQTISHITKEIMCKPRVV